MYYEIPVPPQPENTGKEIWKVLRLQLIIFASYQIGLALLFKMSGQSGYLLMDMFPLILHWLILIVMMIVNFANSKKGKGLGYLISFLV
ncbi:MAG TPA: hypothetical protein VFJ43_01500, partial [Bacteroidia bacterium]|nr:hypothetical protein [Bacteroidia bacterium]